MVATSEVTEKEIEQRVAILKKLRENLLMQREKFSNYLRVLDEEEKDIENEDVDKLRRHVEIENAIVSEIYAFQKVIDPLEEMYRHTHPSAEPEIDHLQESLESIKNEVLERNSKNRGLLKKRMEGVRNQLLNIKKPFKQRSLYASSASPSLVDITT